MTRLLVSAAVLAALLVIGPASARTQDDTTPPQLVDVEYLLGREVYFDLGQGCPFDMTEQTVDEEGGSGVHTVELELAYVRGDARATIVHDYTDPGQNEGACFHRPGLWKLNSVAVEDVAGNRHLYDQAELEALYFFSKFWAYDSSHREDQWPRKIRPKKKGTQTGNVGDLAIDDARYVVTRSEAGGRERTEWTVVYGLVPNGVDRLTVRFKGKSDVPCLNRVLIYNHGAQEWELLDERLLGPDEVDLLGLAPSLSPGRYILRANGPGDVWVRNTCEGSQPFTTSTNVLTIDWAAG